MDLLLTNSARNILFPHEAYSTLPNKSTFTNITNFFFNSVTKTLLPSSALTSPPGPTKVVWKLSTMSMKKMTSTMESTTSRDTSSDVLYLKATLYGTWGRGY